MIIKGIIEEDFVNYKKPSMTILFPKCTFKCEKECGIQCCQNSELVKTKNIEIKEDILIKRYLDNYITTSIVFCGLEPFDSWGDMYTFIEKIREKTNDDIVIYTGYKEEEVHFRVQELKRFSNIIIKYGRFIPNSNNKYDEILGINLSSDNQYAKKIC